MRRSSHLPLLGGLLLVGLVVVLIALPVLGRGGSSGDSGDSGATKGDPVARREAHSPIIAEAKVTPANPSTAKTGTRVGQEPQVSDRVERAEEKPSELRDATPTASWPFFGRLPQRTHYLGGPIDDLDPPFKVLWHINTHALIEFPPAIFGGVAYLVNKYGNVYAVRLKDKKILWTRIVRKRLHGAPIDVTGPAYYGGHVYVGSASTDSSVIDGSSITGGSVVSLVKLLVIGRPIVYSKRRRTN